jgi:hypothetical protein
MALGKKERSIYVQVANGQLVYFVKQGEERVKETADWIEGRLVSIEIAWDDATRGAKAGVKPHWVLLLTMVSDDTEGSQMYKVKMHHPSTASRCLAKYLGDLSAGELFRLSVWQGTNNERVSVLMVQKYSQLTGALEPAVSLPLDGNTEHEKNAEAEARIKAHPSYVSQSDSAGTGGSEASSKGVVTVYGVDIPVDQMPTIDDASKDPSPREMTSYTAAREANIPHPYHGRLNAFLENAIKGSKIDGEVADADLKRSHTKLGYRWFCHADKRHVEALIEMLKAAPTEDDPFADD